MRICSSSVRPLETRKGTDTGGISCAERACARRTCLCSSCKQLVRDCRARLGGYSSGSSTFNCIFSAKPGSEKEHEGAGADAGLRGAGVAELPESSRGAAELHRLRLGAVLPDVGRERPAGLERALPLPSLHLRVDHRAPRSHSLPLSGEELTQRVARSASETFLAGGGGKRHDRCIAMGVKVVVAARGGGGSNLAHGVSEMNQCLWKGEGRNEPCVAPGRVVKLAIALRYWGIKLGGWELKSGISLHY